MNHNPCPVCGSVWHSKMYHKPRKPIKHESTATKGKRQQTAREWHEANPPDKNGLWYCYISKHPLCPKALNIDTLVLEHDLSKARRPDLIHDITNIHPACAYDNKAKGSLSAQEYMLAHKENYQR